MVDIFMSSWHSFSMHRTTIRLNEHLLTDAKAYAVRRRLSLTAVIEEALRSLLARTPASARSKSRRVKFPTFKGSGYQSGIKTWDDVKRALEKQEIVNFRRVTREDATRRR
jgi:hypothetical protein